MSALIKGIKLITHNASGVNLPDDPSYPFLLTASFRPPEFMDFAFLMMHGGGEHIKVRGMTEEALEEFASRNGLYSHPRLTSIHITETAE